MRLITSLIAAAALVPALAQADAIKVGIANDISGPFSALGAEADGFNLAIKQLGGKLGGQPAEFCRPTWAAIPTRPASWSRATCSAKVDFFTGPIGSNVALAVGPALFAAKVPYLSNNPGPSQFAGAQCNPYWFGTSYQNDAFHEAAGKSRPTAASKMFIMAPTIRRAGRAQRLQARLQGRPGRRGLPSWARSTTRPSWRRSARQTGRGLHLPARRHGHQFRQAVRVCRPVAEYR